MSDLIILGYLFCFVSIIGIIIYILDRIKNKNRQ